MNRFQKFCAATAALPLVIVSQAHAALPTEATAAFTSLSTAVSDVVAAAWPIVGAVIVGFVTIKLVKRAAGKV